ncbi:MAG: alpha-ketoglutarate-dependent dioxygenase AlkB family protein [Chlorobiota bacterium]
MNSVYEDEDLIYIESAIDSDYSYQLMDQLKKSIDWTQDEIFMFGRKVKIPRLSSWYGDPNANYSYSGLQLTPNKWTEELIEIKTIAENQSKQIYNSVLLNFYRDGNDSMGWHSDDEKELGVNPAIASVSLGGERRFLIRERKDHKNKREITLKNGSLLIMKSGFQSRYQHSIPKTRKKVGERINLTFRRIV